MSGTPAIYQMELRDIDGAATSLTAHAGKVLFIVNVASKCGFTPHYEGLQELHERYHERGLVVCGFPSNDFRQQEPGQGKEILEFCTLNYGVTFPMTQTQPVRGSDATPLFRELAEQAGGAPRWNFYKYVVDRNGQVVDYFSSKVKPDDPELLEAVQKALGQ